MVGMERHRKLESCGYLNFLFFCFSSFPFLSLLVSFIIHFPPSKIQNRKIEARFSGGVANGPTFWREGRVAG